MKAVTSGMLVATMLFVACLQMGSHIGVLAAIACAAGGWFANLGSEEGNTSMWRLGAVVSSICGVLSFAALAMKIV